MENVKSSCPLCSGLYTCYNGWYNKYKKYNYIFYLFQKIGTNILKTILSSEHKLQFIYVKLESLVIAGQPYGGE